MKLLVTADLHLGDNPRDSYRHAFVKERLPAMVRKHKPDAILILGDLTEEKDRHGAWLVNEIVTHVHRLSELAPVVIVKGNHDYVDVGNPFYAFVGRLSGVSWVGGPLDAKNLPTTLLARLKRTLFLPHTPNFERDWANIDFKACDWIFAHQTFTGADVGFGRRMIDPKIFGKAKVISGDIHVPQSIKGTNVVYVGAPYTVDFGDNYDPRVLLIEPGSVVTSIPCKGPQKRLIEIPAQSNNPNVNAGDIVKLRVQVPAKSAAEWHTTRDELRAWAERRNLIVDAIVPVFERKSIKTKRDATTRRSDDDLLAAYGKARGVDETTMKVGRIIMEKG